VLAWFAFRRLSRGQETRLETFAAR
jgi:hypothetical protein